jgi:protocatechuate 3,4-dioxygenase beta subunit
MIPGMFLTAALLATPQAKPAPETAKPAPPKLQSLEVRVLDDQGRPVPQATVRVLSPFKALLTDAEGLARFQGLKPGSYRVNAGKGGFKLSEQTTTVTEDQPATLEFHLAPGE